MAKKKDYTKFSNQKEKIEKVQESQIIIEDLVDEAVEEPVEDKIEEVKIGVVTNCEKLNVRKEPKTDASIICTIDCSSEVMIDEKEATEDFYKVCMVSGVEGFCMKRYITIK